MSPSARAARTHRLREAFSIIEIVIGLVLIGILVALVAFGYTAVVRYFKDSATEHRLTQVARSAAAGAASSGSGAVVYTPDTFATIAADTTAVALGDGPKQPWAAPGLEVVDGPSTHPGQLSVTIGDDPSTAGLALKSPTGSCAVAAVRGTRADTTVWKKATGSACSGATALTTGLGGSVKDGPPQPLDAPNLTAATGGQGTATITWDSVAGATGYHVFLDAAGTPAATVTGTTAVLEDLDAGTYTITVSAVRGAQASDPSNSRSVTVTACNNDNLACARKIDPPTGEDERTYNVDSAAATTEPGETGGVVRSLWWKITPAKTSSYVISNSMHSKSLRIGTAKDVSTTGSVADFNTGPFTKTFILQGGTTYYLRWASTDTNYPGFTWTMKAGLDNDLFENATTINPPGTGVTRTFTVDSSTASVEPGETGVVGSLWWKITPTTSMAFSMGQTIHNKHFRITTKTDLSQPGDIADFNTGPFTNSYILRAGTTYYIRIANLDTNYPSYTFSITGGLANDLQESATTIPAPTGGDVLTFNIDSSAATTEPGETGGVVRSLWWKVTPAKSSAYVITGNQHNKALRIGTANDVSTTGSIADFNTGPFTKTVVLQGGTTYYIRWASTDNNYPGFTWTMKAGLANDMLADATTIPAPAVGTTATYDVPDSSTSSVEPGETDVDGSLWWKLTPAASGTYTVGVSNHNKHLRIGTSPDVSQPGDVFDANISPGEFTVNLQGGKTYYIRVGNRGFYYANYTLTVKAN